MQIHLQRTGALWHALQGFFHQGQNLCRLQRQLAAHHLACHALYQINHILAQAGLPVGMQLLQLFMQALYGCACRSEFSAHGLHALLTPFLHPTGQTLCMASLLAGLQALGIAFFMATLAGLLEGTRHSLRIWRCGSFHRR